MLSKKLLCVSDDHSNDIEGEYGLIYSWWVTLTPLVVPPVFFPLIRQPCHIPTSYPRVFYHLACLCLWKVYAPVYLMSNVFRWRAWIRDPLLSMRHLTWSLLGSVTFLYVEEDKGASDAGTSEAGASEAGASEAGARIGRAREQRMRVEREGEEYERMVPCCVQ